LPFVSFALFFPFFKTSKPTKLKNSRPSSLAPKTAKNRTTNLPAAALLYVKTLNEKINLNHHFLQLEKKERNEF